MGRNRESLAVLREMGRERERDTIGVTQAISSSVSRKGKKMKCSPDIVKEERVTNIY